MQIHNDTPNLFFRCWSVARANRVKQPVLLRKRRLSDATSTAGDDRRRDLGGGEAQSMKPAHRVVAPLARLGAPPRILPWRGQTKRSIESLAVLGEPLIPRKAGGEPCRVVIVLPEARSNAAKGVDCLKRGNRASGGRWGAFGERRRRVAGATPNAAGGLFPERERIHRSPISGSGTGSKTLRARRRRSPGRKSP